MAIVDLEDHKPPLDSVEYLTDIPNLVDDLEALLTDRPTGTEVTAEIESRITLGGDPSGIGIDALGVGGLTARQLVGINAAGNAIEGVDLTDFQIVTASQGVNDGDQIAANTTAGVLTLTLPAAPAVNARIAVIDAAGNFATNPVTLARNGKLLFGDTDDSLLNINNLALSLVFLGDTLGWRLAE